MAALAVNINSTSSCDWSLTLKLPIATKVVCFSRLIKCLRSLYGKQCGPRPACSGSTLFASILNSLVMLGNYLLQTTSADDIFRCIFFLGALRVKAYVLSMSQDKGIFLYVTLLFSYSLVKTYVWWSEKNHVIETVL